MPYADTDTVRVYCEEQGQGDPVLLLHNYFGTIDAWLAQREPLGRRYRVIAADARGHGRTGYPGGRLRLAEFVADAIALIHTLGFAPAHLVGSSLGALTALQLAREQPGLVRTVTAIGPPYLAEPLTREYMDRVVRDTLPANRERWEREHRHQGEGHVVEVLVPNFERDWREQPVDQIEAVERAGEIRCPVLVAGGDNDPVFPLHRAVELAGRIPEGELLILPRAEHFPHRTQPGPFNRVLLDFLHRHP